MLYRCSYMNKPHYLGGSTWDNFRGVCATGLSKPLPQYSLFCGRLETPSFSHFGVRLSCLGSRLKNIKTASLNTVPTFLRRIFSFINLYSPEFSYSQNPENLRRYSSNYIKNSWKCDPVIVSPVVKMWPYSAAHPHLPINRKCPYWHNFMLTPSTCKRDANCWRVVKEMENIFQVYKVKVEGFVTIFWNSQLNNHFISQSSFLRIINPIRVLWEARKRVRD